MMSGGLYRLLLVGILAVGLITGMRFLLLYRPTRWLRNPIARDSSGWVVVVTGLYAWSLFRLVVNWVNTSEVPRQPLPTAVFGLLIGVLLDGALLHRLLTFMAILRRERTHPTRLCPQCGGTGVVSAGEAGR